MKYSLSSFFIAFSTLNLFWFVFRIFFFVKSSNNFFSVKITNDICPWHSVFNFFNLEKVFGSIYNTAFSKNVFIFWYSNNITNFKFHFWLLQLQSFYQKIYKPLKKISLLPIILWICSNIKCFITQCLIKSCSSS